jgi:uncharacterized protein (UPF0332 family)
MMELTDRLFERSEAALRAARRAAEVDDAETAANRAYYAMFGAASALLAAEGMSVRRHSAVHAAFGERFVKSGRLDATLHRHLLSAFDLRQVADYDPMVSISLDAARRSIEDAADFLAVARAYIERSRPMIQTLSGLPEGVLGFQVEGPISADDYRNVVIPPIAQRVAAGQDIRAVLVFPGSVDFTAGAAWQDLKLGLGDRGRWKRVALVADHEWMVHLVRLFAWLMPGEFEHFPLADRDAAIAWAAG